jgi:hypothetical protein
MSPIPPSSVLFVMQSGYSAERVMPILLNSVNGLVNGSNRFKRRADPRFTRLVRLVSEAQLADSIQIRIERRKEGPESSVVAFPPRQDPAAIARRREITTLLGLSPDLREFSVYYGAYAGRRDESI